MPQRISSLIILMAAGLLLSGCATKSEKTAQPAETNADNFVTETYQKGRQALDQRNLKVAYNRFAELSEYCADAFAEEGVAYRTARTITEQMTYLVLGAARGETTHVITLACSDAYYYRAYIAVELQQIGAAESYLATALEYAPMNSYYLNEKGYIEQAQQQWKRSIETYEKAAEYAQSYAPEDAKMEEFLRAKRGIGYSLIEMNNLSEAEQIYLEVLEINPDDEAAQNELEYIRQLQAS